MKHIIIRSRTDVITNSSTEVFTLKTTKTPDEVWAELKTFTSGFERPEIMSKDSGVLKRLIRFGYLIDRTDRKAVLWYQLKTITEIFQEDDTPIPGSLDTFRSFIEYVFDNLGSLSKWLKDTAADNRWIDCKFWDNLSGTPDEFVKEVLQEEYIRDWQIQDIDYYPPGFIESFLDSCQIPDIPEYLDADTYVGQVGFAGTTDNSISYEDFERICKDYNGHNWHLG